MAFCKFCGKEIPDGSVCDCPEAQKASASGAVPEETSATKNSKTNLVLAAGIIIVLLIILGIISAIAGSGYKKPIKDMVKGLNKADGQLIMEALYTDDMLDDMADDEDVKIKELYDEMDDELEDALDDLEDEYGKNIKVSVKFEDKKELSDKKLEDYEDRYDDYYDADVKITKGYEVETTLKIKGKDDDDENEMTFIVLKIKGEGWKLYPGSFISFLF